MTWKILYRLRDSAGSTLLQGSIGDIQDRLASVGIKGDEANRILDMYALDPDRTDAAKQYLAAEHAQAAAGRPWDEQVRDAYIRLANQRDIPMDDDDDLYRDKQTTRDARNAVEQVISYFHPEADSDRETAPGAAKIRGPLLSQQKAIRQSDAVQCRTEVALACPELRERGAMDRTSAQAMANGATISMARAHSGQYPTRRRAQKAVQSVRRNNCRPEAASLCLQRRWRTHRWLASRSPSWEHGR